jgi:hypothetical protein
MARLSVAIGLRDSQIRTELMPTMRAAPVVVEYSIVHAPMMTIGKIRTDMDAPTDMRTAFGVTGRTLLPTSMASPPLIPAAVAVAVLKPRECPARTYSAV